MDSHPSRKNDSLKDFFLLVVGLSIPIWLVGGARLPLPVKLPVSALTAFVPAIAAAILSFRRKGSRGMQELLQMAWDYRKIRSRVWYVPVLLLAPFLYLLAFVIMWVTERPLPDSVQIPFLWLPVFVVLYLITGAIVGSLSCRFHGKILPQTFISRQVLRFSFAQSEVSRIPSPAVKGGTGYSLMKNSMYFLSSSLEIGTTRLAAPAHPASGR